MVLVIIVVGAMVFACGFIAGKREAEMKAKVVGEVKKIEEEVKK